MRCVIRYDSEQTGRNTLCLKDVITGEPRVFDTIPEATRYAKLSCFRNPRYEKPPRGF